MTEPKPLSEKAKRPALFESAMTSRDKKQVYEAFLLALEIGSMVLADPLQERWSLLEIKDITTNENIKAYAERRLDELDGKQ
jgi:hypothetical protein